MNKYNYNFIDGGWNQEQANTKQEAIAQAKKRWADCPNLIIDVNSFRVATDQETDALMSLFH